MDFGRNAGVDVVYSPSGEVTYPMFFIDPPNVVYSFKECYETFLEPQNQYAQDVFSDLY